MQLILTSTAPHSTENNNNNYYKFKIIKYSITITFEIIINSHSTIKTNQLLYLYQIQHKIKPAVKIQTTTLKDLSRVNL